MSKQCTVRYSANIDNSQAETFRCINEAIAQSVMNEDAVFCREHVLLGLACGHQLKLIPDTIVARKNMLAAMRISE